MALDIVPEMLQQIQDSFDRLVKQDRVLSALREKVASGRGTYLDAHKYALLLSNHCSRAILQYVTPDNLPNERLYYNIAQRILTPQMTSTHRMINSVCRDVQTAINKGLGMDLNPLDVELDTERINNLAGYVADLETLDMARTAIDECVENYNLHVVDESIKRVAEFQGASGIKAVVRRTAEGGSPCDTCKQLQGTYEYKDIIGNDEIWMRHRHCKCVLEYFANKDYRLVWSPGR